MEIEIKKQEKNLLLGREEISAEIKEKITPKEEEVKTALAEKLQKPVELVIIKGIYPHFGEQKAFLLAYVYNNIESLKKFEPKIKPKKEKVEKKEKIAKPEKKAEQAGEESKKEAKEKPEEKPKEETKEKPAEEEKGEKEKR